MTLACTELALIADRASGGATWGRVLVGVAVLAPLAILAREHAYAFHDSLSLYEQNVAAQPDSWAAHYNFGVFLRNQGKENEAIDQFHAALRIVPKPEWRRLLGAALLHAESLDEAADALEQDMAGPLDERQRLEGAGLPGECPRGTETLRRGQPNLCRRAEEEPQRFPRLVLRRRGAGWSRQERRSHRARRQSIKINPRYPESQSGLGRLLMKEGRHKEAIDPLSRAAHLRPSDPGVHEELAAAYLAIDKSADAQRELTESIRLRPNNP